MSLKTSRFTVVALASLALLAAPALAEELESVPMESGSGTLQYISGEILVKFGSAMSSGEIEAVAAERGCAVAEASLAGFHVLSVPDDVSEMELAAQFGADPGCEWASPNFVYHGHHSSFPIPPDDPFYGFQTHLALIDIETAWAKQIGSQDVVVAVLDSGVAYENRPIPAYEAVNLPAGKTDYFLAPDLAQTHFIPGFDFINNDAFANDDYFHGTGVTATITQDTNNGFRAAGVAPGVTIMPVKTNGVTGTGPLSALLNAIVFATANDVDVINMSLGFPAFASDPAFDSFFVGLDAAIEAAHDAGIVLVASTGNEGVGVVSRPALHPDVIAVGANNLDGVTRSGYSQFSSLEATAFATPIPPTPGLPGSVELTGPVGAGTDLDGNGLFDGVLQEIIFPNCPDTFGAFFLTGTSFSAPQVAGVAALMISEGLRPSKDGLGVDTLRQILRDTAIDLGAAGNDLEFGAGQVNAGAAVCATKVTICHRPPGNPSNAHTLSVGISAVAAHINNHPDSLGPCP